MSVRRRQYILSCLPTMGFNNLPRYTILYNHVPRMQMTERWESLLLQKHQTFKHLTTEPRHLRRRKTGTRRTVFTIEFLVPCTLEVMRVPISWESFASCNENSSKPRRIKNFGRPVVWMNEKITLQCFELLIMKKILF